MTQWPTIYVCLFQILTRKKKNCIINKITPSSDFRATVLTRDMTHLLTLLTDRQLPRTSITSLSNFPRGSKSIYYSDNTPWKQRWFLWEHFPARLNIYKWLVRVTLVTKSRNNSSKDQSTDDWVFFTYCEKRNLLSAEILEPWVKT